MDLLERIQRELDQRLAHLAPAAREYERLTAARAQLSDRTGERTRAGRPRRNTQKPIRRSSGKTRAPRGENVNRILTVVEERPGVSVAEVAQVAGVARGTVDATISRLRRQGLMERLDGGGVRIPRDRLDEVRERLATAAPR